MSADVIEGWISEVQCSVAAYQSDENTHWIPGLDDEENSTPLLKPSRKRRRRSPLAEMDENSAIGRNAPHAKRRVSPRKIQRSSAVEQQQQQQQQQQQGSIPSDAARSGQHAGVLHLDNEGEIAEDDEEAEAQADIGGDTPRPARSRSGMLDGQLAMRDQDLPTRSNPSSSGSPSRQRTGRTRGSARGGTSQGRTMGSDAAAPSPFVPRRDLAHPHSAPSDVSSSSTASKRSRSPAKSMSDLRFADIEMRTLDTSLHTLPASAHTLFASLQDAANGDEIIPEVVREKLSKIPPALLNQPRKPNVTNEYHLPDEAAINELSRIRDIVADAAECRRENLSEATWNIRVHDPLLRLAVAETRVKNWPVTTATIIPSLVPRNAVNGDLFSARLVDFALTLEPEGPDQAAITHLLASQATPLRYLNQTTYGPLRFRPGPIAIETKAAAASETGESQLAIWTKAWRTRMGLLGATHIPFQPLVRVYDHVWVVLFAWDDDNATDALAQDEKGDRLVLLGELQIGDTRSILGVYKILKAIRQLATWLESDFYKWFSHEILVRDN